MPLRQTRLLLRLTTLLFAAATVAVVWWVWPSVDETSPTHMTEQVGEPLAETAAETTTIATADFDALWDRPLRRPLYDPPPPPQPAPVVKRPKPAPRKTEPRPSPPPKLDMRLVGTILESGRSMAIVADAAGKIDLKGAGETLDLEPEGVRVESINAESVTVSHNGREQMLKITKAGKASRSRQKKRNRQ